MNNATTRFSNRVADYIRYRPSYPPAVISHLQTAGLLTKTSVIADVGSGTGILAELFLRNGNTVYGIEPNLEMRRAGEQQLGDFQNFQSVNAAAEATTLPDASVDLITAGQAFHWFDRAKTKTEFRRILRPNGYVALIWNERLETSPFLVEYEKMLHTYSPDYATIDHRHISDDHLADFFHPNPVTLQTFSNQQIFDYESLQGRLQSSSYAPVPGHPNYEPMLADLKKIFARYEQNNQVAFDYETKLFTGQL
jgi:ubiquinone/menaquinone biosynthesis C-methylase UbiE